MNSLSAEERPIRPFRIRKTVESGTTACYVMEPFSPGYGVTIGHPLQKALLMLPGAAITAMCIEGVQDASQEIAGVAEDVSELVLNLKQVRLRCEATQPVTLYVNVHGAREVTAEDITCPQSVGIVNPHAHLATLTHEQAHLVMTLTVTSGKGYVPAPEPTRMVQGTMPLDAIYTPVVRVDYRVEPTRVGYAVNYDRLVMTVTTNGTLTPDEALCLGGDRLTRSALALMGESVQPMREEAEVDTQPLVRIPQHVYDKPLKELGLPIRSYNSLKRIGCETAGHILTMSEEDLRSIRNIGDKSLQEIVEALQVAGCLPASFAEENTGKEDEMPFIPL